MAVFYCKQLESNKVLSVLMDMKKVRDDTCLLVILTQDACWCCNFINSVFVQLFVYYLLILIVHTP